MIVFKLLRVILHLLVGLSICALAFPRSDRARRERHIRGWSARLLRLCGVQLEVRDAGGVADTQAALVVANHVSWLDVFVINAVAPCRFVAKSDIRGWPLIGRLCQQAGTVFIARGRPRDVRRIYQGLVEDLRSGERIAFFPEGTTASQGSLLPFHANLFEAAVDNAPVQPYALCYFDHAGRPHGAVDFVGETTFAQSMIAILKSGGVRAELVRLPMLDSTATDRRQLALAAHAAIAAALAPVDVAVTDVQDRAATQDDQQGVDAPAAASAGG